MQIVEMHILDVYISKKLKIICKITLVIVLAFSLKMPLLANDITISNINLSNHNPANQTVEVSFDVTWNNSWRHPVSSGMPNWDAAWIFGRFSLRGENTWLPIVISAQGISTGSGTPSIAELKTYANDDTRGIGMLVHRSEVGSGTFSQVGITFTWEYGNNRPDIADLDLLEIRLFGIEMVYVPGGPFYLGSGGSTPSKVFYESGTNYEPFRLSTLGTFTFGGTELIYNGYSGSALSIPSGYPSGVYPFYLMKHELTQQMMVNYFNSDNTGAGSDYNYNLVSGGKDNVSNDPDFISRTLEQVGNDSIYIYSAPLPNNPVGYANWSWVTGFSDWAGLRPYSELEFEKAARGWFPPKYEDEYPWGSNSIVTSSYTVETLSTPFGYAISGGYSNVNSMGNAVYYSTIGTSPHNLRVGVFANDTSSRAQSSASMTGVLDLAGNVAENVANIESSFDNSWVWVHGDGLLNTLNQANESWPGWNGTAWSGSNSNGNIAIGRRGGSAKDNAQRLWTSDREYAKINSGGLVSTGSRAAVTRDCILPNHSSASYPIEIAATEGSPGLLEANIGTASTGQEFIWILQIISGEASIIQGQGSNSVKIFVSQSPATGTLYAHSVNDCGISLESSSVEVNNQ